MTDKQRRIWTLYQEGHKKAEIAAICEISSGYVWSTIDTIQKRMVNGVYNPLQKPSKNKPCPYSASCFTCPCPDCYTDAKNVASINRLPTD